MLLSDVPSAPRFLVDDSSPLLLTLNLKSAFSRGFSFRKLQIFISQTTDFHFANYRFSFRKLQIFISQTTDFHFVSFHFVSFHFVSLHFVSQTTVSQRKTGKWFCEDAVSCSSVTDAVSADLAMHQVIEDKGY